MSLFSSKTDYGHSLLLICNLVCPEVKKQQGKESSLYTEKLRSPCCPRYAHEPKRVGTGFRGGPETEPISTVNKFSRRSSPGNAVTNGNRLKGEEEASSNIPPGSSSYCSPRFQKLRTRTASSLACALVLALALALSFSLSVSHTYTEHLSNLDICIEGTNDFSKNLQAT